MGQEQPNWIMRTEDLDSRVKQALTPGSRVRESYTLDLRGVNRSYRLFAVSQEVAGQDFLGIYYCTTRSGETELSTDMTKLLKYGGIIRSAQGLPEDLREPFIKLLDDAEKNELLYGHD
ncbi:MAG: hypothetical protein HYW22_00300 [Candidatus Aenigmarchaeota archaeon]|nr:hypothetical protein [Candidatus Aenigmarchaeota archaeon]